MEVGVRGWSCDVTCVCMCGIYFAQHVPVQHGRAEHGWSKLGGEEQACPFSHVATVSLCSAPDLHVSSTLPCSRAALLMSHLTNALQEGALCKEAPGCQLCWLCSAVPQGCALSSCTLIKPLY